MSARRPEAGGTPVLPTQPSLRRLKRFGLRPNRELGQHFLIDSNLLEVIANAAELEDSDVVLEIGGGLGVLSEHLAERAAHVHVVELDPRLEPALRDALDPHPNTTLHLADAMEIDLAALSPPPGKVVANLPYGIAAPAILRTLDELPGCGLWVAMVQREVGQRLAAAPGTAAYGKPSVLAQLVSEVSVLRPVSRTVFHPVPNVDSVLIRLRRRPEAEDLPVELRQLVRRAFAHRRKALAGSLALSAGPQAGLRERVRRALEELGHPPDERAERLAPDEFRELWRRLG